MFRKEKNRHRSRIKSRLDLEGTSIHMPGTHLSTLALPSLRGPVPLSPQPSSSEGGCQLWHPANHGTLPITTGHPFLLQREGMWLGLGQSQTVSGVFPFKATGEDALKGRMRFWNWLRPCFLLHGKKKKEPACNVREQHQQWENRGEQWRQRWLWH